MNCNASQNQLHFSATSILPSGKTFERGCTRFVHSFAVLSCLFLSLLNSRAIIATRGSSGLGSHSKAKIYRQYSHSEVKRSTEPFQSSVQETCYQSPFKNG